jgi:hypothetical protein
MNLPYDDNEIIDEVGNERHRKELKHTFAITDQLVV